MLQDVKSLRVEMFCYGKIREAAYILGIKIYKDRLKRLIGLCQSAYIEKILKRFHMENSKRGSIPMQDKPQNRVYSQQDMFLVYGGDIKRELRVSCYTDAGYLTDADDLKSQTFAYDASKEAVWIRKFISGLGVVPTIEEPITMYCDNTGAITIANESRITKGARHYRAKVHYLHEVIELGDVKIEKVHTDDNLAEPFTKALPLAKHSEHTQNIGMLPASSLM
ncbi:hypothetical protein Tco_0308909 [Tanacetum coccineum]